MLLQFGSGFVSEISRVICHVLFVSNLNGML